MSKLMVGVAVLLVANAELRAQGFAYYSPYTTNSSGNSAGQVFGVPGSFLHHAAVRIGGVAARLPEPANATSSFAYCISPNSQWVGGMAQTATGVRTVVRWKFEAGNWRMTDNIPTPSGAYFAYPLSIGDNGTAVVCGYAASGFFTYSWPATVVSARVGAAPVGSDLIPLPIPDGLVPNVQSAPVAATTAPAAAPVFSTCQNGTCAVCQPVPQRVGFFRRVFGR